MWRVIPSGHGNRSEPLKALKIFPVTDNLNNHSEAGATARLHYTLYPIFGIGAKRVCRHRLLFHAEQFPMSEYLVAVILGIIQGLTEFIPVSSSGHLIIATSLLGLDEPRIDTFLVVIQFGSILAVVVLYWSRFRELLLPSRPGVRFAGARGLYLLFLTCLPASLLGLFARNFIKGYLFNPFSVALALAVGACLMLLLEARESRIRCAALDEITPKMALGIGCCQCLALWPGFSRSASTIMGGMLMGANRSLAVEYSFIAAVPIMMAATGYDLLKSLSFLTRADIPFFLVGSVVSFLAGLAAVKAFTGLVARISLRPFAVYRLALAPLVYWFFI